MMGEFTDELTGSNTTNTDADKTKEAKEYLAQLVGEGKKFETLEAAAEALAKKALHGDKHIETIIAEKRELEEKYKSAANQQRGIDDVLAAIEEASKEKSSEQHQEEKPLTLEVVLAAVNETNTKREAEQTKLNKIAATMKMLVDDKAFASKEDVDRAIVKYINNDPNKKDVVNVMAVSDPAGLLELIKTKNVTTQFTEDHEGIATINIPDGELSKEVLREVLRKNPDLFHSKEFQLKIHNSK